MAEEQLDTQTDAMAAASDTATPLLRRKAQAGRQEQQARAMSLPKAMRLTLAKVADDLFGMAMATLAVRLEQRAGSDLDGVFDPASLMILLDGPNGQRGAVTFDSMLVGALIQQQTMGQVLADPGGTTRVLTATDAAICVPFLDALLSRTATLPEVPEEQKWLDGYKFGARAEDPRLVLMALEAPNYRIMRVSIDIAGGVRQGQMTLCLPLLDASASPLSPNPQEGEEAGPAPKLLLDNVLALNAELNIALARLKLPLRELGALKAGDVLPLPGSSFESVNVLTMAGRSVATGALGQVGGQRAVRLTRRAAPLMQPRRRASDRAELDLPEVQFDRRSPDQSEPAMKVDQAVPDGPSQTAPPKPAAANPDLSDPSALPDLPDLPDMSDLPGFGADDEFPELPKLDVG
ncbi:FliM/FliN family flagellar motor switch protein [Sulfitobacter sp. S0837]|uniref:flagellar motor switch protein FliM n=1 Tax=Sulfitobacter maritimus TaxID=2741719 RepID=UPI0015835EBC|nr:FliM/FliN family flagellar motor C-terminal domain-containing protein [Sulfitobacter maritimus]NUH64606.1 FliM/FliN family flagellar motor switch protein [Sulfitobacter maritimus]